MQSSAPPPAVKYPRQAQGNRAVSADISKPGNIERIGSTQPKAESQKTAPPSNIRGILSHGSKEGKDFPAIRTSSLDVDGIPLWEGKPITEVDIDADLAEHSKAWRLPGTDQTDFFNYGFDEYTWTQYAVRQQTMGNTISQQKEADAQMKAFFGGGSGGGAAAGGMPGGMPGMPPSMPMPDPAQMMEMVNQGVIPPEFAQMMQMGGGMPGMGGPGFGNQQGGNQFGGQQGGGFGGGSNPNSISPQPQGQGGFQPPSGPSGGQQGFQPSGMEGYSSQQLQIMQQEQQGGGGSGGRGRGRKGRGYY